MTDDNVKVLLGFLVVSNMQNYINTVLSALPCDAFKKCSQFKMRLVNCMLCQIAQKYALKK